MAGNLPVVPSRASLSASGRAAALSTMRNSGSQHFFGSAHNNVSRPASFQQQTANLRQSMAANHVGAIPAGGRSGAGESTGFRGATASGTTSGTMQKPSAGTVGERENNSASRSAGNRSFSAPSNSTHSSSAAESERTSAGSSSMGSRSVGSGNMESQRGTSQSPAGNGGGYRSFTPPSSSSSQASRGGGAYSLSLIHI